MAKPVRKGFRSVNTYTPYVFFENKGEEFHGRVLDIKVNSKDETEIRCEGYADSTCKAGKDGDRKAIENGIQYLFGGAAAIKFADHLAIGQEFVAVYNGKIKTKNNRTANDIELLVQE